MGYTWHLNLSEPSSKNPLKLIYITTFYDVHSHNLTFSVVQFNDNKQLSSEVMKEIEFLTVKCKMGAATQRQYLETKFPGQMIYDDD